MLAREPPFGPAVLQAPRRAAGGLQTADRLVRIGAQRAAAVGDDLAVRRQVGETLLELVERDRTRALDVTGRVLLRRPHVDEHDLAASEACDQLVASDRLDVLTEVVPGGSLDFGQLRDRCVAQRQPQRQRLVPSQRVAHAGALARARDHPRGVQRLQVLGGVRRRLLARPRELVHGARRLRQQIEQLKAPRAGERLAHQRDRFEERVLLGAGIHSRVIQ